MSYGDPIQVRYAAIIEAISSLNSWSLDHLDVEREGVLKDAVLELAERVRTLSSRTEVLARAIRLQAAPGLDESSPEQLAEAEAAFEAAGFVGTILTAPWVFRAPDADSRKSIKELQQDLREIPPTSE